MEKQHRFPHSNVYAADEQPEDHPATAQLSVEATEQTAATDTVNMPNDHEAQLLQQQRLVSLATESEPFAALPSDEQSAQSASGTFTDLLGPLQEFPIDTTVSGGDTSTV